MPAEQTIPIATEADIVAARQAARQLAAELGFGVMDQTRIVTAVSELTRNIVRYAGGAGGLVRMAPITRATGGGIEIVVSDAGPGIADLDTAMRQGYSSGNGLGLGLGGTKRLMDEMEIETGAGKGTTVLVRKWRH